MDYQEWIQRTVLKLESDTFDQLRKVAYRHINKNDFLQRWLLYAILTTRGEIICIFSDFFKPLFV